MTGKIKLLIMAALMAILALSISACGKTETGEMTGKLTGALGDSVVVDSDGQPGEFITGKATVYDLGDYDHLTINDEVHVEFHTKRSKSYADTITLEKHFEEDLTFSGVIVDVQKMHVTVTGNVLTVKFLKNIHTDVSGDLNRGDRAEVVYAGNMNAYPVAKSIKVIEEKKEPKQQTVSGIVTDFTSNSIGISIDSAHSFWFLFDAKTKISGVDKYVNTGDSIAVTFAGDIDNEPAALEIKINRKGDEQRKTLSGTIKAVGNDQIVVDTGESTYIIKTDKNTKYTGEKPAEGYMTQITYYGVLGGKATATMVQCARSETDGAKGTGGSGSKPEAGEVLVKANATIIQGDEGKQSVKLKLEGGEEITLNFDEDTQIAGGYIPEKGDMVSVTYEKSSMMLRDIQLISRPEY